ncbi:MAG TPA: hypothetical protein P5031_07535 [Candidatus Syntrophosphaera sp.]|jgi:hypothetical protein|nr:hypothetical protein [Candidatus Syntrophosphaera sp.]
MDFEELKENLKHISSTLTGLVASLSLLVGEFGYQINIPPEKMNKIALMVMAAYLVFGVSGKKKEG